MIPVVDDRTDVPDASRHASGGVRLRAGWHELDRADGFTLARHWPARFDLSATAQFAPLHPRRLARQIRQDMWRALQEVRGFSPAVEVTVMPGGLLVRAGGRLLAGPAPAGTARRLDALLADPALRARWGRWARLRGRQ